MLTLLDTGSSVRSKHRLTLSSSEGLSIMGGFRDRCIMRLARNFGRNQSHAQPC
jgi:hypothetical protein